MHRARDSQRGDGETSDVPSLGRPRVSVQSAEMRRCIVGAHAGEIWVLSYRENEHSRTSVCASSANVTACPPMRDTQMIFVIQNYINLHF